MTEHISLTISQLNHPPGAPDPSGQITEIKSLSNTLLYHEILQCQSLYCILNSNGGL